MPTYNARENESRTQEYQISLYNPLDQQLYNLQFFNDLETHQNRIRYYTTHFNQLIDLLEHANRNNDAYIFLRLIFPNPADLWFITGNNPTCGLTTKNVTRLCQVLICDGFFNRIPYDLVIASYTKNQNVKYTNQLALLANRPQLIEHIYTHDLRRYHPQVIKRNSDIFYRQHPNIHKNNNDNDRDSTCDSDSDSDSDSD